MNLQMPMCGDVRNGSDPDTLHVFRSTSIQLSAYSSTFSLIYIKEGTLHIKSIATQLCLKDDHLMLIEPNHAFTISSEQPITGIYLKSNAIDSLFEKELLRSGDNQPDLSENVLIELSRLCVNQMSSTLKRYLDTILNYPEDTERYTETADILALLKHELRIHSKRLHRIKRKRMTTRLEVYKRTLRVKLDIDQNCRNQLNLDDLSKRSSMSKFDLIRSFKEAFGITPRKYFIEKRIELAKVCLKQNQPIMEVAHACGYPDIYSFSKQFKKILGCSPSKYLRM